MLRLPNRPYRALADLPAKALLVAILLSLYGLLAAASEPVTGPVLECPAQVDAHVSSALLDRLSEPGFAHLESAKSNVLAHPEALCSLRQMALALASMDASGLSDEQAQWAQELLSRILLILSYTET